MNTLQRLEKCFLGGIIKNAGYALPLIGDIQPKHFESKENQEVFRAIHAMHSDDISINAINLIDTVSSAEYSVSPEYIDRLVDGVPSRNPYKRLESRIREAYSSRHVIALLESAMGEIGNPDAKLADISANLISEIESEMNSSGSVDEFLRINSFEWFKHLDEIQGKGNPEMLKTGFVGLDESTGGFKGGDVTIVAGRPGSGKSAFALQAAWQMAKQGLEVAFLSLEMDRRSIERRLISHISGVPISKIKEGRFNDQEKTKLKKAASDLAYYSLRFDVSPRNTIGALKLKLQRLKTAGTLDVIFVDYLQLLEAQGGKTTIYEQTTKLSRDLKLLAKSLDIPVFAMAQVNRKCEERKDKRPELSDLRDSGSLEQDADNVVFLYRDSYYTRNPTDFSAEVRVAKAREGSPATSEFKFAGHTSSFFEITNGI